ncbi:MAG: preprotein translocase subunit SecE [Verrucomicrobiota bacterium]|nr:preprotein translocase subunit SecE [Verrucomicrobiota bacterium]
MNILKKIKNFYEDTVSEVKKCTWPTKTELLNSTILVVVTLLIMMVWIGFVDKVSSMFVRWVINF